MLASPATSYTNNTRTSEWYPTYTHPAPTSARLTDAGGRACWAAFALPGIRPTRRISRRAFYREGAIVSSHPSRPEAADLLQVKRGMMGVLFQARAYD